MRFPYICPFILLVACCLLVIECYQASAVFEVYADGKQVFKSGLFRGTTPPEDIQVDVSGAQMLKLVISECGNGWGGDWVMWGKASLQWASASLSI